MDDDQDLTRTFQVIFESRGFEVIIAENGTEGFEKLKNEKPDLAIFDVMMRSNLEGYNLLHEIKKDPGYKNIPIIVLTGMMDALGVNLLSAVEDEARLPNVIFRDKPIDPSALLELIEEQLK